MSPSPHSERLREIRVYLAEDAAIDDMPRAHPSSPTPMLRDLLAAYDGLGEQFEELREALRVIAGEMHDSPSVWLSEYRFKGGGYEGLQAVARGALYGHVGADPGASK